MKQEIDNVINEILSEDLPDIETSAARKAEFVNQIKLRIDSKKGFRRTIEALRCMPAVFKFYKKETSV